MPLLRMVVASAFIIVSGTLSTASAQGQGFSRSIDRPGGDYRNFDIQGAGDAGAEACRAVCNRENRCRAWTFVKAGIQGASARCWLKSTVPSGRANPCCTSGVKGGQIID
jgi:hypothetical protein